MIELSRLNNCNFTIRDESLSTKIAVVFTGLIITTIGLVSMLLEPLVLGLIGIGILVALW